MKTPDHRTTHGRMLEKVEEAILEYSINDDEMFESRLDLRAWHVRKRSVNKVEEKIQERSINDVTVEN